VWGPNTSRRFFDRKHWLKPYSWNAKAKQLGVRLKVFCASMADVFEDHPELPEERQKLWKVIEETPHLDWLLLTKRPENIMQMIPVVWHTLMPLNIWMGTTAENQEEYDTRLPYLAQVPARVRFLSCEPLLGPIDLYFIGTAPADWTGGAYRLVGNLIHWVIVGGESGHKARPMNPKWARSIEKQCKDFDIAFFFKQWGSHDAEGKKVNSKYDAGKLLDGVEHIAWP
jgi:protein gp37